MEQCASLVCDMPPTGGLLGDYQGIAGDYAGIFPGDPSNNLGGLLACHFIGLIILHMLSSKCMFVFFSNSTSRGITTLKT